MNDTIGKVSRKVNALSRVMPCMSLSKKKKTGEFIFNSQFNYCLLIWMFHSHIINDKFNRLHERCLRLLDGDKWSSFEKLLQQDKSVAIRTRNLQILPTGVFKVHRNISPLIFGEIFHQLDINYKLRINSDFAISNVRSVFHGSKSISYLGPKIWDIVLLQLKELSCLQKRY